MRQGGGVEGPDLLFVDAQQVLSPGQAVNLEHLLIQRLLEIGIAERQCDGLVGRIERHGQGAVGLRP